MFSSKSGKDGSPEFFFEVDISGGEDDSAVDIEVFSWKVGVVFIVISSVFGSLYNVVSEWL